MLLEFTVGNYLSFKDKKTLSLEASSITEFADNVVQSGNFNVLKSAVLYGANSSGKSNLINALTNMFDIILKSAKSASTDEINVTPFLLNTETEYQPSFFELLFLLDGVRYRYGFEADKDVVHTEWLYMLKKDNRKETELFVRIKEGIEITKHFKEGEGLEQRTRENGLFLSVVDQFNGEIAKRIMTWIDASSVISGLQHEPNRSLTMILLRRPSLKDDMLQFLTNFNLGFERIYVNDDPKSSDNSVKTYHRKFNERDELIGTVEFLMNSQESSGTNKLFDMAGYILYSLIVGALVIIDELDAKLHPLMTQAIVSLFHNRETNRNNAQLIFATHDTNLLSCGEFRRDQIYFAEKDHFEATDLYSLVEYKDQDDVKVRKDRKFEKDYIEGRYGAIPFVGNFKQLFSDGKNN